MQWRVRLAGYNRTPPDETQSESGTNCTAIRQRRLLTKYEEKGKEASMFTAFYNHIHKDDDFSFKKEEMRDRRKEVEEVVKGMEAQLKALEGGGEGA